MKEVRLYKRAVGLWRIRTTHSLGGLLSLQSDGKFEFEGRQFRGQLKCRHLLGGKPPHCLYRQELTRIKKNTTLEKGKRS
jgi:hypothetical protein